MSKDSSLHFYLNWAKERIDEMDAALASIEAKAAQLKSDSRAKTDQLIADLKNSRDAFRAMVKKLAEAGDSEWQRAKMSMESEWDRFQALVKSYIGTLGKQVEHQQMIFQDISAAQFKAWRAVADKFQKLATEVAAARRAEIDAAVKRMQAEAAEAEARLQKLNQAGIATWSAMNDALAQSRKAFDQANKKTWDAFRRAEL